MAEYLDGVGAWGAWQVEPSKFTQLVVDSMRTLYVLFNCLRADEKLLPSLAN